jgi:hypothetical protein
MSFSIRIRNDYKQDQTQIIAMAEEANWNPSMLQQSQQPAACCPVLVFRVTFQANRGSATFELAWSRFEAAVGLYKDMDDPEFCRETSLPRSIGTRYNRRSLHACFLTITPATGSVKFATQNVQRVPNLSYYSQLAVGITPNIGYFFF